MAQSSIFDDEDYKNAGEEKEDENSPKKSGVDRDKNKGLDDEMLWKEFVVTFSKRPFGFKLREGSRSGLNVRVKAVTDGSMAFRMGVKTGAYISKVNEKNVWKKQFQDIKKVLKRAKCPMDLTFKYNATNAAQALEPQA